MNTLLHWNLGLNPASEWRSGTVTRRVRGDATQLLTVAVVDRREVSHREPALDSVALNHVATRVVGEGAGDEVLRFVSLGETVGSVCEDVGGVPGTVDFAENRAAIIQVVERVAARGFGGAHAVRVVFRREAGVARGAALLVEGQRDGVEGSRRASLQVARGTVELSLIVLNPMRR